MIDQTNPLVSINLENDRASVQVSGDKWFDLDENTFYL